jgi:hypothetical protein
VSGYNCFKMNKLIELWVRERIAVPSAAFSTDLPYKVFLNCQFITTGATCAPAPNTDTPTQWLHQVRFACAALHVLAQCILNIPCIFALNNGPNSGNLWAYFAHAQAYQSHDLHYNLIVPCTSHILYLLTFRTYCLT